MYFGQSLVGYQAWIREFSGAGHRLPVASDEWPLLTGPILETLCLHAVGHRDFANWM